IREFDIATQLSTQQIKKAEIMPNVENKMLEENRESFLQYIKEKTLIVLKNYDLTAARLDKLFKKAEVTFQGLSDEISHQKPSELFLNSSLFKTELMGFNLIELGNQVFFSEKG